jgi:hypothetical protein
MGSEGIEKLSYNNTVLFDASVHPADTFSVLDYEETANGTTTSYVGSQVIDSTSWNASNNTLTLSFAWGTVGVKYTIATTKVSMAITVTNTTTSDVINGLNIAPLALYFPIMPAGFATAPQEAFGPDVPGVVVADFGTGAVAMVQENVTASLYCGFLGHNTFENGFEPWVGSTPLPNMPTSWPLLNDPIAPGTSSTYNISLRFGAASSTATSLAPDVFAAFAAANQNAVNWSNRNPIGMLTPAGLGSTGTSATNPRNWFGDPTINVTTPAGLAAFSAELLAYAANSIQVLKSMGAQGMITWDIEGVQYASASYVGDPNMATTLAPELTYNNLVGQYFALFRNAGLETGVTIRPQEFVYNNGNPYQETLTDPTALVANLVSKIDYAQTNWGCTLFYIDSTDPNMTPTVLEQVHQECPNVLLIPEQSNVGEYAYSAPFEQIQKAMVAVSPAVSQVDPTAFMVIDPTVAQPGVLNLNGLESDVKAGDILMVNGAWSTCPANLLVQQAYKAVSGSKGASSSTTKTTVRTAVVGSEDSSAPIADLLSSGSESISNILTKVVGGLLQ